ncbi:MAG: hypothetical protein RML94_13580, partial [Bacteroidia bacterium]|nr:hypothetical protein [Bacteroidia bacterium]
CVYRGRFEPHDLLRHNICHQAIFTKKSVLEELGGFDLSYPIQADYAINLQIFLSGNYKTTYTDKIVAYYNSLGKSSLNLSESEKAYFHLFRSKLWNEYCSRKSSSNKKNFINRLLERLL